MIFVKSTTKFFKQNYYACEIEATKTGQLVVVQTCWIEVPTKPMRYLRLTQEDLDAATTPVPGAAKVGRAGVQEGGKGGGEPPPWG